MDSDGFDYPLPAETPSVVQSSSFWFYLSILLIIFILFIFVLYFFIVVPAGSLIDSEVVSDSSEDVVFDDPQHPSEYTLASSIAYIKSEKVRDIPHG